MIVAHQEASGQVMRSFTRDTGINGVQIQKTEPFRSRI